MSTVRDTGIVGLFIGSGTTKAATAPGYPGTPRILQSGDFRFSDTFNPGNASVVAVTVQGTLLVSGKTVVVGIERQRSNVSPTSSGLAKWSLVQSTRTDTGVSSGIQVITTPAAFTGQAVDTSSGLLVSGTAAESLAVTLTTTNLIGAGNARVIVAAGNGILASGDFVLVSVDSRTPA